MSICHERMGLGMHWGLLSSFCVRLSVLSHHSRPSAMGYIDGACAFQMALVGDV